MITLRLFHSGNAAAQLDERTLGDGGLVVGRDAGAGWTIDDPSLSLSRRHCTIGVEQGRLTVIDTSSNGVFFGTSKTRLTPRAATIVPPGEVLRLGEYIIVADQDVADLAAAPRQGTDGAAESASLGQAAPQRAQAVPAIPATDGALLEAFCRGAGVDASSLSNVEPLAVMDQVGRIYQEMVRGLRELMSERISAKSDFLIDGTTVRAEGNNPFRWAPANRVAVDMLRPQDGGFLGGPEAVRATFDDVKDHLTCTVAGMRGAVASILRDLDPHALERRIEGRRPLMTNRTNAAWTEYVGLHGELKSMADRDPDELLQPRFREAYEDKARQLEALPTGR